MCLGQVHVFRGDDDDVFPDVLVGVVVFQSFDHVVAFTDVGGWLSLVVGAEEDVDSGSLGFLAGLDSAQVLSPGSEHVAGPVENLGGHQATDGAVDEKETDLLAIHADSFSFYRPPFPEADFPQRQQVRETASPWSANWLFQPIGPDGSAAPATYGTGLETRGSWRA